MAAMQEHLEHGQLAPVLLADATWYGTLAAVRDLGSRGVPVTLACDARVAPARWSRFVTSTVRCPSTKDAATFLAWLHEFGDRNPGHVLYPTSDDAAWVIATNREELAKKYRLYSPSAETLAKLLDKGQLAMEARAAGLLIPETWLPEAEVDLERVIREAAFPVFVKPRTQILAVGGLKGGPAYQASDLAPLWRASRLSDEQLRRLGPHMRQAGNPLVQSCYPVRESIYTVDGFVDGGGEMVVLGCTKILQRPRNRGPGIIFDHATVPAPLVEGLRRLWLNTGFQGVFDIEFIRDGDRTMLIDLNPRFYNHMALEIDRGMPLPWLAYLGALGDGAALRAAIQTAREQCREDGRVYVHKLPTHLMLSLQRLFGNMSGDETRRWREWIAERADRISDPVSVPGDRLPAVCEVFLHAVTFARHPRSFLGQLAGAWWLDQLTPGTSVAAPGLVTASPESRLSSRSG
jgi:D-aspartate ligase